MYSMKSLPRHYAAHSTMNLSKNRGLAISLNIGALVLFFLIGWLFWRAAILLHPDLMDILVQMSIPGPVNLLAIFILLLFIQAFIHELTHAFFFWLFTDERPRFSLKWLYSYAYAAAPNNCYLSRNQYLIAALAPFLLITLFGAALLPVLSVEEVPILLFIVATNAAGAVGDLFITGWLLRQPANALVHNAGVVMVIYRHQDTLEVFK